MRIQKLTPIFLFSVCCLTVLATCEKNDANDSFIYGTVTDIVTHEPLQGASVIFFEGGSIYCSQTTGSDGRYSLVVDKDINGYSDFIRVICAGYETIETADIDLKLGSSRQLDYQMTPTGTDGPDGTAGVNALSVEFYNATNVMGYPWFIVSNSSATRITNIFVRMDLLLAYTSQTWTISLEPGQAYKITNYYNVLNWYYGDRITLTVNGSSRVWTY